MTRSLDHIISPAAAVHGLIYFIANFDAGVVKIGFATNLDARLSSIQTGNHMDLTPIFSFRGCRASERLLHRHFADDCVRGEWFAYTDEIDEIVEDLETYRDACAGRGWPDEYFIRPEETAFVIAMLGKPLASAVPQREKQ